MRALAFAHQRVAYDFLMHCRGETLSGRYSKDGVMDCKFVGSGEPALLYLGRYFYRIVIRNKNIVACADGQVSFRDGNVKTGRMERRTVFGADFLWRLLQHVQPKEFWRTRNSWLRTIEP